jgi:flagellar biosynthesis protein FliR
VQSAGQLIDINGGLQLGMAFDPGGMVNGAQFARLFQMVALALLFASDGYQLVILGLTGTFQAIPIGGSLDFARTAEALMAASSQMILSALLIAGPLVIVLFLADLGLALLTRVAPALNAFAMSFPLKILIVVIFGGTVLLALPSVVSGLTETALRWLTGVTGG